jgi:hypothetical protein
VLWTRHGRGESELGLDADREESRDAAAMEDGWASSHGSRRKAPRQARGREVESERRKEERSKEGEQEIGSRRAQRLEFRSARRKAGRRAPSASRARLGLVHAQWLQEDPRAVAETKRSGGRESGEDRDGRIFSFFSYLFFLEITDIFESRFLAHNKDRRATRIHMTCFEFSELI